jgi:hypothetical protein
MNSKNHISFFHMSVILFCNLFLIQAAKADVIEDNGRTYLIDQTGERWDITQARTIGFEPRHFQFGIGRNAFRALKESDWPTVVEDTSKNLRVIGVADGDEAHAYSVSKLSRHETANTQLEAKPIVVGY